MLPNVKVAIEKICSCFESDQIDLPRHYVRYALSSIQQSDLVIASRRLNLLKCVFSILDMINVFD
jgi:predicted transcriptional regulator